MNYQLRYLSLFNQGRGYSFPCDEHGTVDIDKLSQVAKDNYLYVRAMVGRDFAAPVIKPTLH